MSDDITTTDYELEAGELVEELVEDLDTAPSEETTDADVLTEPSGPEPLRRDWGAIPQWICPVGGCSFKVLAYDGLSIEDARARVATHIAKCQRR